MFLKIGNYIQNKITTNEDLSKVLNSISTIGVPVINESNNITINIHQGVSIIETEHLVDAIFKKLNTFPNMVTPVSLTINNKIENMKVTQNFYGAVEKVINAG